MFGAGLQHILFNRSQGPAWDIANGDGEGNGWESYRQPRSRGEPSTGGTKRAVPKQLSRIQSTGRAKEVGQARYVEESMRSRRGPRSPNTSK